MKTVADALTQFDTGLASLYPKPEAGSLAYLTLEHVTGLVRTQLRAFPQRALSTAQAQRVMDVLQQLLTGKPIQYVLGETEFYGLPFKVNPSVLIPRPETEELVAWVLKTVKERQQTETILDIGTGSGCIPITLKKHLPNAKVSGMDISAEALIVAKENADLNKVDVDFIEGDILKQTQANPSPLTIDYSPLTTHHSPLTTKYSVIISNPPYVTGHEKLAMHNNVLGSEPHLALFVPDDDPLLFYRAIADFALLYLKPNGYLFMEINENLGEQMVKLLYNKYLINTELKQDLSGKDRMIRAQVPGMTSRQL